MNRSRRPAAAAHVVPPEYRALYDQLDGHLEAFTGLPQAETTPALGLELYAANSIRMEGFLAPGYLDGVRLVLDGAARLGLAGTTVTVQEDAFNGPDPDPIVAFYSGVAAEVRARGLRLYVQSSSSALVDYAAVPYEAYVARRRRTVDLILQHLRPDWCSVSGEPDAEQRSTGYPQLQEKAGYLAFLARVLSGQQPPPGCLLGAGCGAWMPTAWTDDLAALPGVAFLGYHVYAVNYGLLGRARRHVAAARAAGKAALIPAAWLYKESDGELLASAEPTTIYRRDVYAFWEPLDQKFLHKAWSIGADYLATFWSQYLFAQIPYDATTRGYTYEQGRSASDAAARAALQAGTAGPTGAYFGGLVP